MSHDNSVDCPSEYHVMSIKNSRPKWTNCSIETINRLTEKDCLYDTTERRHLKTKYPGKNWTLENQCRAHLG